MDYERVITKMGELILLRCVAQVCWWHEDGVARDVRLYKEHTELFNNNLQLIKNPEKIIS